MRCFSERPRWARPSSKRRRWVMKREPKDAEQHVEERKRMRPSTSAVQMEEAQMETAHMGKATSKGVASGIAGYGVGMGYGSAGRGESGVDEAWKRRRWPTTEDY